MTGVRPSRRPTTVKSAVSPVGGGCGFFDDDEGTDDDDEEGPAAAEDATRAQLDMGVVGRAARAAVTARRSMFWLLFLFSPVKAVLYSGGRKKRREAPFFFPAPAMSSSTPPPDDGGGTAPMDGETGCVWSGGAKGLEGRFFPIDGRTKKTLAGAPLHTPARSRPPAFLHHPSRPQGSALRSDTAADRIRIDPHPLLTLFSP